MTDQSRPDPRDELHELLHAAAAFARASVAVHPNGQEIINRHGEQLVLTIDLARMSLVLAGRLPGDKLAPLVIVDEQNGHAEVPAEQRN
jgi:hypothetical protein